VTGRSLAPTLALITAILTAYRLWVIQHLGIDLYVDEVQYWTWSQALAWGYFSKPPVIAALIAASTALLGNNLIAIKLPSLLLYPATTAVLYALGKRLYSARVGFWAGLGFMSGPLVAALGLFIVSATLLGWAFVGMAYVISAGASEKSRAAGLALVVWFAFVLVFDLGLLGFLVATGGAIGRDWLPWLLLLNPADVFRLANLAGFDANATAGPVSIGAGFPVPLLLAVQGAWVLAPFALAVWRFRRR